MKRPRYSADDKLNAFMPWYFLSFFIDFQVSVQAWNKTVREANKPLS
jgi:hypothetical protein